MSDRYRRCSRLLVPLALAWAGMATAQDVGARADLSLEQDEAADATERYFRQAYQLGYHHRFSDPILYGVRLRYQEDRGESRGVGGSSPLLSRLASPAADLSWNIPEGRMLLAWDLNWGSDLDPATGLTDVRTLQRLQGVASWHPLEEFDLGVHGDRSSSRDPAANLGSSDLGAGVSAAYRNRDLRVGVEERYMRLDDTQGQVSRTSLGPRGAVEYSRQLGPTASVQARYVVDYLASRDTAAASTATIPVLQTAAAGLYVLSDLPIDTSTTPMVQLPGLIDRNLTAPAGIPLGPDGVSFANVGLDLGRFITIDELELHVRGASGIPVPFGGTVAWTVYSSADGVTWAAVDGASASFSVALSAYVITLPKLSTRFVKAVNFGVNTVQTDVTELQAYAHEQPTRSSTLLQSVGLSGSWRPVERVALSYSGQANLSDFSSEGRATQRSQDLSNALSATAGPFGPYSFQLSGSQQVSSQVGAASQGTLGGGIALRYDPIPRFGAMVEARRSELWVGGVRTTSSGAVLTSRAEFYDTLKGSISGAVSRQQISGGGTSDYLTASTSVAARPLQEVDLSLLVSVQRTYDTQGDVSAQVTTPQIRIAQYQRYLLDASYHPGPQLALSARLGWTEAQGQGGLAQTWRLSWNPFPDGAVLLAFDYNEDIDPLSGQHFRRAGASPRWTLNRHAYLELVYNYVRGTGATPVRAQNLYLTLSVSL